jgi:hypothetical protein
MFYDLELDQCTTCSKIAHKVKMGVVLGLSNFLSPELLFSFGVPTLTACSPKTKLN